MRTPRSLLILLPLVVMVALVAWLGARGSSSTVQDSGIERASTSANVASEARGVDSAAIDATGQRAPAPGPEAPPLAATTTSADDAPGVHGLVAIHGRALLLDGTPLGGFRVSAHAVEANGTSGSATIGNDGSFVIEGLEEGGHEVSVRSDNVIGSKQAGIFAPADGVELRLDAVLVELHVETESLDWLEGVTWLKVEPFGSSEPPFSERSGGARFNAEGVCRDLLPTGPAYLFRVTMPDETALVAMLERGLVSGLYREELVESLPTMGRLCCVLASGTVEMPDRVRIRFAPILDSFVGMPPRAGPRISLRGSAGTEAVTVALPGRYSVTANLFDLPPLTHRRAVLSATTVDLKVGGAVTVNVRLEAAGRAAVTVQAQDSAGARELTLELWHEATGKWGRLSVMYQSAADRFTSPTSLPFGVEVWTSDVLSPGPARLRLRGVGWETIEETLEIVAGEVTPWRAQPRRVD